MVPHAVLFLIIDSRPINCEFVDFLVRINWANYVTWAWFGHLLSSLLSSPSNDLIEWDRLILLSHCGAEFIWSLAPGNGVKFVLKKEKKKEYRLIVSFGCCNWFCERVWWWKWELRCLFSFPYNWSVATGRWRNCGMMFRVAALNERNRSSWASKRISGWFLPAKLVKFGPTMS